MTTLQDIQMFKAPNIANSALTVLGALNTKRALDIKESNLNVARSTLQETKAAATRKAWLEANDFTLNLLSGVTSQEDLDKAREILMTRYPRGAANIDKSIPKVYDPDEIRLVQNALRTAADRVRLEEPKAFAPGSYIYKGGEKIGEVPPTPPKPSYEVFEDSEGNQIYVKKGGKIPKGYRKVQPKASKTQITVNTGDLTKTTKTRLEKDIIEGVRNLKSFKETRKLFKPEYLTLYGKGKDFLSRTLDKMGLSNDEQKKFIRDRQKWFRKAKADAIAFRKWATGVAGGEKELKEIATAFPDPVNNSPEQYIANLDSIEDTTKQVLATNKDFLRSGIDLDQPLDKILEEAQKIGIPAPPGFKEGTPSRSRTSSKGGGGKVIVLRYDSSGNRIK